MNFEFKRTDPALTRSLRNEGFALSASQLDAVRVWQTRDYQFNMHTSYHGSGESHYVYVFAGSTQPRSDVPRMFVNGTRAFEYVPGARSANLGTREIADLQNVLRSNQALFLTMIRTYYNIR